MEIIVHVLNDETHKPKLENGNLIVQYTAKRGESGEVIAQQAATNPAEVADFNEFIASQARDEAGGNASDTVTVFGGVSWRGQPDV